MLCRHCNKQMKHVLRFDKNKIYEFYRCSRCYAESKKLPYYFKQEIRQKKYKKMNTKTDSRGKREWVRKELLQD